VISIEFLRAVRAQQSAFALNLIRGRNAINLTDLARSIRANHDLCDSITGAACREFGWPSLRVEDAIVLLGAKRLRVLISTSIRRGCTATKHRRTLHSNSITPSVKLCLLETFQGELK
jgi:hypothetical protein